MWFLYDLDVCEYLVVSRLNPLLELSKNIITWWRVKWKRDCELRSEKVTEKSERVNEQLVCKILSLALLLGVKLVVPTTRKISVYHAML